MQLPFFHRSRQQVQLTRLFQILGLFSSTFLNSDRGKNSDPSSLLQAGYRTKPNIRQGRTGLKSENDIYPQVMSPARVYLPNLGGIEGYHMRVVSGRKIYAFEGIPYAEPPVRFSAPVAKKPWNGTIFAKSWGKICVQTRTNKVPPGIYGKEDCLTLNVYSPELPSGKNRTDDLLPVIIFIHGGAFSVGSSTEYGPSYLMSQDIVLVTLNYRLGVFGFLSTGTEICPGNWGLKDQALAISWVHQHIGQFGGDSKRLVLMGQSAGAVAVHLHLMSPLNKNKLFAAIALSGSAFMPWGLRRPTEDAKIARRLTRINLCSSTSNVLGEKSMDCLRSRSLTNITVAANLLMVAERKVFMPVIEPDLPGAFITQTPTQYYKQGKVAKIPFICTMTSKELELSLAAKLAGLDILPPIFGPPIVAFSPVLLDYQDKVFNEGEVTKRIVAFYGGDEKIGSDPEVVAKMATDRHFSLGIRKALKFHLAIAPTYSYYFDYRNHLGFANDLRLNPFEFGVPHGEDIIFLFNRTGRKPISRVQSDFAIVKLIQTLFTNFATSGEPLYTSELYEDFKIWQPVTTDSPVRFLKIDRETMMTTIPDFQNATDFWSSLNILDV